MKVQTESGTSLALLRLLNEARAEADDLRRRLEKHEKTLLSTRLIMGHELKRPTTAIRGYLDLALEQSDPNAPNVAAEAITKARDECKLLNELNSFFLELLKIEASPSVIRGVLVNVEDCINEIIVCFPDELRARERISVHISPDATEIRFNPSALRIILSNVLENALIYSDLGTPIEVHVERAPDKRGLGRRELIKIRVVDQGKGIPEGFVKRIFKPFVRLHGDIADGAGLGLTLVRSLVELRGGSVYMKSEMDQGTTAYITVPETTETND